MRVDNYFSDDGATFFEYFEEVWDEFFDGDKVYLYICISIFFEDYIIYEVILSGALKKREEKLIPYSLSLFDMTARKLLIPAFLGYIML